MKPPESSAESVADGWAACTSKLSPCSQLIPVTFCQEIRTWTHYIIFFENRWALRNILNRASVLWSVCLGGTVVKYLWVMDSVFCQVVTSGFYFDWLLSQVPYFLRPYLSGFKIELQSVTVLADWMSISTAWSRGLMLEHRSDPHLHPSQATVRLSVTLELQRKPRPDLSIFLIRHILLGFFAFLLKTTSKHN